MEVEHNACRRLVLGHQRKAALSPGAAFYLSGLAPWRSQRCTYGSKNFHEDFGARPLKLRVISLRRVTDDERLSGIVEVPLDALGVDDLVRYLAERKRLRLPSRP
jgi:hypothetical protein